MVVGGRRKVYRTKYRRAVEVKYIIGSGNHTRSYLGVVNDQLVELPLTCNRPEAMGHESWV